MGSEDVVVQGARVTVVYLLVFLFNIAFQVYAKKKAINAAKSSEKYASSNFNRYAPSDKTLLAADRVVANYLEWAPFFLSLFWLSLYFKGLAAITPGYTYVFFRFLYLIFAANGGITRFGPRETILIATIPMYMCLIYMLAQIIPFIL
jgi:hypothetical protein